MYIFDTPGLGLEYAQKLSLNKVYCVKWSSLEVIPIITGAR